MRRSLIGLILVFGLTDAAVNEFVTCDFDLGSEVEPRLPVECRNLDEPTRAALLQEAESFKVFNEKLTEYESSQGLDTEEVLYKDWEFRAELYGNAELNLCQNTTEILVEYLDCLVEKRALMVLEIEEKIANGS
uniref:Putative secreted protein n=1 Tax=Aedes albopictus TaxID=7160 RepID=A0A023EFW3_AEDAL